MLNEMLNEMLNDLFMLFITLTINMLIIDIKSFLTSEFIHISITM